MQRQLTLLLRASMEEEQPILEASLLGVMVTLWVDENEVTTEQETLQKITIFMLSPPARLRQVQYRMSKS